MNLNAQQGHAELSLWSILERMVTFTSAVNVAAAKKRPSDESAAPWFTKPALSRAASTLPVLASRTASPVFAAAASSTPCMSQKS